MELKYPWVIYLGIAAAIILVFISFKSNGNYKDGRKVANDSAIKNSSYYKKLKREYTVYKYIVIITTILSVLLTSILIARPIKVDTVVQEIHNRDIVLCLDTSDSTDECNIAICDRMIKLVDEFKGERIGVTIFNGKPVNLVPLTTDYQYVKSVLERLNDAFKSNASFMDPIRGYKYAGTLCEDGRGSSFVGDGLVAGALNFYDLKDNPDRPRIIIYLTDNDVMRADGKEYATLKEAMEICGKYNIKVFSLAPKNVVDEDDFREYTEATGGKFYVYTSDKVVDKLRDDVQSTDSAGIKTTEINVTDEPQTIIIILVVLLLINFVAARRLHL